MNNDDIFLAAFINAQIARNPQGATRIDPAYYVKTKGPYMPRRADEKLTYEFFVWAETDKALFVTENPEKVNAQWLPKSQIEYDMKSVEYVRDLGRVEIYECLVPRWLADEKGFETP